MASCNPTRLAAQNHIQTAGSAEKKKIKSPPSGRKNGLTTAVA